MPFERRILTRNKEKKVQEKIEEKKSERALRFRRAKKEILKEKKEESRRKTANRLEKHREANQKYLEKIREDPKKYENYCRKERERYNKKVLEGKIKKTDELTDRELRARRKYERDRKQNYREKLKLQKVEANKNLCQINFNENVSNFDLRNDLPATISVAECSSTADTINPNNFSHQKCSAVKRVQRNKRQCYKKNKKLQCEVNSLKTKLNTMSKRFQRLKLVTDKNKKSEKSKTQLDTNIHSIDNLLSHPAKHINIIRKKLIEGEVLQEQIRLTYRGLKKNKEKQTIGKMLSGKICKKYKCLTKIKRNLAPVLRREVNLSNSILQYDRKLNIKNQEKKRLIHNFLFENSSVDPSKKGCKKDKDGNMIPRHYLNGSLVDLHQKNLYENESCKVSYPTFCKFRPKNCVALKVTERETCACLLHENINLIVQTLFKNQVIVENTCRKIVDSLTCDNVTEDCLGRKCASCKDKQIEFKTVDTDLTKETSYCQWITEKETRISGKTQKEIIVQKTKKENYTLKLYELISIFKSKINILLNHEMYIYHQFRVHKCIRNNLKENEAFIVMDFSENYNCKYSTEIQSVHFGANREQVSLHAGYIYSNLLNQGFGTISDYLKHTAAAVLAHLRKALEFYLAKLPNVHTLYLMSDGPFSQYRNKSMFYLISQHLPEWFPQIKQIFYNYSVSGHGKSEADGSGSILKRTADSKVKYGVDIPDFDTFLRTLQSNLKNMHVSSVTMQDIQSIENILSRNQCKAFSGTAKVHQFTWRKSSPNIIYFNSLSCYECPNVCKHYNIGKLEYNKKTLETPNVPEKSLKSTNTSTEILSTTSRKSSRVKKGKICKDFIYD